MLPVWSAAIISINFPVPFLNVRKGDLKRMWTTIAESKFPGFKEARGVAEEDEAEEGITCAIGESMRGA